MVCSIPFPVILKSDVINSIGDLDSYLIYNKDIDTVKINILMEITYNTNNYDYLVYVNVVISLDMGYIFYHGVVLLDVLSNAEGNYCKENLVIL